MKREDQGDQLFVTDAGPELAVEQVAGGFREWRFVNLVNGEVERLDVEEAVFYVSGIVLEALIDAAASAGGLTELAASGDLLGLDAADGFLHEGVVIVQARERGRLGFARGGPENLVLGFGDRGALLAHRSEER